MESWPLWIRILQMILLIVLFRRMSKKLWKTWIEQKPIQILLVVDFVILIDIRTYSTAYVNAITIFRPLERSVDFHVSCRPTKAGFVLSLSLIVSITLIRNVAFPRLTCANDLTPRHAETKEKKEKNNLE